MAERKIRVVLADDHETVRAGLRAILAAQPDITVIAEVADGNDAVAQAKVLRPEIVLMDVSMPGLDGVKATQAIKDSCPDVKVLALTRHAEPGYVQQLLRAGASGYVLKQSRAAELLHAVRAVHRGGTYLDPAVASRVVRGVAAKPLEPHTGQLTPREEEVLRLVAWGYSNKEMAERLGVSVKTIETHKANAMQKLRLQNRVDVVRYAVLQGWLEHD